MKIVCDNCATKYSIADEKVRGKVFKIRCKKCSHIIVVKGTEGADAPLDASAPADAAPAETSEPAADGWHVVVNGEQVGPLSPTEVRGKFSAGEIDAETFAWKEGFGDWQRLASIDEFSDLATVAPAAAADATRRTGPDDLFGGGNAEPALNNPGVDLFGGSPAGGDLFSGGHTAPAQSDSGGLFSQPAAMEAAPAPSRRAPTPGFGNQAMPDAAPAEGKAMTGQRNENSVLFSLNNLQALASGGASSKPAPAAGNSGVDNRPGFANSQTEGSGLIDIRAMAAATLSSSPAYNSDRGNMGNDLPQFASAPVFSPIAAPILMPSAPSGTPGWVWPVVGLSAVTLFAIIGFGIFLINKANVAAQAAVNQNVAATATAGTAAPVAANPAGTAPVAVAAGTTAPAAGVAAPTAGTPAANPPVAVADKTEHSKDHSKSAAKGSKAEAKNAAAIPGTKVAKNDAPSAAAEPTAASASKPKKGGRDDLDSLLDDATSSKGGGKSSAPKEERASAASNDDNLPDQLDKGAIVGGMGKVKGKVGACYEQYKVPGMANVAVTIGKNGRVSNAAVSGAFAGTPTGDCVSKAVKTASFPQFKGSPQSINYPFMLR